MLGGRELGVATRLRGLATAEDRRARVQWRKGGEVEDPLRGRGGQVRPADAVEPGRGVAVSPGGGCGVARREEPVLSVALAGTFASRLWVLCIAEITIGCVAKSEGVYRIRAFPGLGVL